MKTAQAILSQIIITIKHLPSYILRGNYRSRGVSPCLLVLATKEN